MANSGTGTGSNLEADALGRRGSRLDGTLSPLPPDPSANKPSEFHVGQAGHIPPAIRNCPKIELFGFPSSSGLTDSTASRLMSWLPSAVSNGEFQIANVPSCFLIRLEADIPFSLPASPIFALWHLTAHCSRLCFVQPPKDRDACQNMSRSVQQNEHSTKYG